MKGNCHFAVGYLGINERGDVFPCCKFIQKDCIGNIHDAPLDSILQKSSTIKTKQDAREEKISCFKGCTILIKEAFRDSQTIKTLFLRKNLNCNLRCTFCTQNHSDMTYISNDLILKRINFSKIEAVNILGGEPFLDPETIPLIKKLYETYNTKIIITTNGNFLDEKSCKILMECCSEVTISINGSTKEVSEGVMHNSNFDQTLANVKKLISMRLNNQKPIIRISQVITKHTLKDIPNFQKMAKDLGVESRFLLDDNLSWPDDTKERIYKILNKEQLVEIK